MTERKGGGRVNMLWADLTLRSVMIRCKICILDVVTRCAENMSSAWLVNFVATRIVSCERREIDAFMQVKRRGSRQRNYFWSDFSHGIFFFFVCGFGPLRLLLKLGHRWWWYIHYITSQHFVFYVISFIFIPIFPHSFILLHLTLSFWVYFNIWGGGRSTVFFHS